MNESPIVIAQPLKGTEIKLGIAVRMTRDLPEDVREPLKERIIEGLGKTCSLLGHTAYAKFKATWKLHWWRGHTEIHANWWVTYELNDLGRVTSGGMGDVRLTPPDESPFSQGVIDEVPPDRFRRETDQPIPKPTELKPKEQGNSTFSKSIRGSGKRRDV